MPREQTYQIQCREGGRGLRARSGQHPCWFQPHLQALFWRWGSSRDAQVMRLPGIPERSMGQGFMGCLWLWLGLQNGGLSAIKPTLTSALPLGPPDPVHHRPWGAYLVQSSALLLRSASLLSPPLQQEGLKKTPKGCGLMLTHCSIPTPPP